MRSPRTDRLLIEDMRDAIDRIAAYTEGMEKAAFLSDRKTVDAVVRNLEVVGVAANRLTAGTRDRRSDIEWPQIIGLRNRVVHEYFGVDTEIVWEIINKNLPGFKHELQSLLTLLSVD